MRLTVSHVTTYSYEPAVDRIGLRLRLFPSVSDGQAVEEWEVLVNDELTVPLLRSGFGDDEALFMSHEPLSALNIVARGVVNTKDTSGVVSGLPGTAPLGVFLRDTPLTQAGQAIIDLGTEAAKTDPLDELHELSRIVRRDVDYVSGSTDADTTAAQALNLGRGVCQDHAHVFCAAARSRGHPARYVAGYLLPDGDGGELHQTHAWAEAHVEGIGWVGFDPSNNICPTERYIRLGCGLDSRDATPVRGAISGMGAENLVASVVIEQAQ
ncbi:transglutaminase family protein [Parvularcula sp. IMCC14364]|uniref:transglutaminase family protein n=1 Tax=Parvularcula sp. IMCC14364 TaxID=3067902 RepID=UPI00274150BB|nr:transglutaminase family protein [Parvularcula sp. IMCC14364]